MDDVERLIEAFRARSTRSVLSKLDALLDLEQLDDPRIVPFLVHVLADQREPTEVRIHVLKRLRNGRLQPADRQSVAEAVLKVLSDRSSPDLRLQAGPTPPRVPTPPPDAAPPPPPRPPPPHPRTPP